MKFPGRMETVNNTPLTILDGAHNASSIKALFDTLNKFSKRKIIIFALAKDKDAKGIMEVLSANADILIVTKFQNSRAMELKELCSFITRNLPVYIAKDLTNALLLTEEITNKDDLVCITGSFYLVGEYKKLAAN